MADTVAITAAWGTTIAADDVGAGVLVQRVKACLGADGTAVDPIGGSGATTTAVQRVLLATDSSPGTAAYSAAVSLTRTNDTNVYAANDVIGAATGSTAALTFANMGASAGRIQITGAQFEIAASAA